MAFDFSLRDFVVRLVVDEKARAQFLDPAQREASMAAAGLTPEAKDALRASDEGDLRGLLNQQVAVSKARPKAGKAAAAKKRKKKVVPAKKKAGKKR